MNKTAVYPGSFDPVTNGHIDIIKRAVKLFGTVTIAVIDNTNKKPFYSVKERMEMLEVSTKKIKGLKIMHFTGLLVNFMKQQNARVIIRGLRELSDFEYEFQMALMNRKLSSVVETVFLVPAESYTFLSSSVVREVTRLGGNVKGLVPKEINKYLDKLRK